MAGHALERFIAETRSLFDREPDLDARWTAMTPILGRLLADADLIAASKAWPTCTHVDGRAENLLFYEDSEYKFAVQGRYFESLGPRQTRIEMFTGRRSS